MGLACLVLFERTWAKPQSLAPCYPYFDYWDKGLLLYVCDLPSEFYFWQNVPELCSLSAVQDTRSVHTHTCRCVKQQCQKYISVDVIADFLLFIIIIVLVVVRSNGSAEVHLLFGGSILVVSTFYNAGGTNFSFDIEPKYMSILEVGTYTTTQMSWPCKLCRHLLAFKSLHSRSYGIMIIREVKLSRRR